LSKPPLPILSDEASAIHFVATGDLIAHDLGSFVPARVVLNAPPARVSLRLSPALLARVQERARLRGMSTARYIRYLLERDAPEE
jgi:predicted DNA binding CopG/RHH family protein